MHKSILTFGLLASSLVMLSVLPFLNNNSAMAQGYDIYRDNGYYSQYPTDDKKYECRTGPFEGFFVGSVEFCKHVKFDKDDDRKDVRDNRTGDKGPTGDKGLTGDRGQPGTAGFSQLNSTNVYRVPGIPGSTALGIGFATCFPGDVLIDGGFTVTRGTTSSWFVQFDRPAGNPIPNSYEVFLQSNNPDLEWDVFAYCFDNPPLRGP